MSKFIKLFSLFILFCGMVYATNVSANHNPHIRCELEMTRMAQQIPGFRMPDCSKVCGYARYTHVHHPQGVEITDSRYRTPHGVYLPHLGYMPQGGGEGYGGYNDGYGAAWGHDRRNAPAYPPYYDGYRRAQQSGFNFFGLFYKHNQEVFEETRERSRK